MVFKCYSVLVFVSAIACNEIQTTAEIIIKKKKKEKKNRNKNIKTSTHSLNIITGWKGAEENVLLVCHQYTKPNNSQMLQLRNILTGYPLSQYQYF